MKPIKLLLAIATVGLLTFTSGAQSFITNGLVAFYPFKGNANDVVGTNNGVIYGGVTLAPDRFGSNNSAYLFDGTDGYINIGSPAGDNPTYLTETAWVKILSRESVVEAVSPTEDVIICKREQGKVGAGWPELSVVANGPDAGAGAVLIDADAYINGCVAADIMPTNVWFSLGEVCSNDTYQIYINGVLQNMLTDTHPLSSDQDMYLMHSAAWSSFCNGVLDDVRIYNRPLSSNEMAQLYAVEAPPVPPVPPAPPLNPGFVTNGLVAFYPFKGNANDVVGTNNGVIYGGVTLIPDRFGSNNSAYLFDGTDGYIDIGSPAGDNPTYLTETAWVKILSRESIVEAVSPTVDVIICKREQGMVGAGWPELSVVANGPDAGAGAVLIDADQYINDCVAAQIMPTNIWFSLGEVCSNDTYQIYMNGVLQNTLTDTHPLSSDQDMYLMHSAAWSSFCNGALDDVRIYNRPLSSNEMAQLYAIEATPPQTETANATAIVVDGFLVDTTIIDGGNGYTNVPLVHIIGSGGSGAQAVAVVSNGVVIAINMLSAGSGYTNEPLIVVDPPIIPNPVLSIAPASILDFTNLTVGGSYQLQQFQSWYWTNQSSGFTASNNVYEEPVSPGEYRLALGPVPAQAFATAQVEYGFVVDATITAGGSGYLTPPTVEIVGDVGTNATAVAGISDGAVTGITITDAGIGYTNLVTVEIAPPPATALSPTTLPGIQINSSNLAPYDNYQIQFKTELGAAWENWSGGIFSPNNSISSQFMLATNSAGFFRLEYLP